MSAFRVVTAALLVALAAANVIVHAAGGHPLAATAWLAVIVLVAIPRLVERVQWLQRLAHRVRWGRPTKLSARALECRCGAWACTDGVTNSGSVSCCPVLWHMTVRPRRPLGTPPPSEAPR